jgi:hypothetical protein
MNKSKSIGHQIRTHLLCVATCLKVKLDTLGQLLLRLGVINNAQGEIFTFEFNK